MSAENQKPLRWSDVWILMATYHASSMDGAELRRVIAVADYIERAIPNFEEISSGLVRLNERGLVWTKASPFRMGCTRRGFEIVDQVADAFPQARRQFDELVRILGVKAWSPEPLPHPDNDLIHPNLTQEEFQREVDAYLKSMS